MHDAFEAEMRGFRNITNGDDAVVGIYEEFEFQAVGIVWTASDTAGGMRKFKQLGHGRHSKRSRWIRVAGDFWGDSKRT